MSASFLTAHRGRILSGILSELLGEMIAHPSEEARAEITP